MCAVCNDPETIHHFLVTYHRFASLHPIILERPIFSIGLAFNTSTFLSFGATQLVAGFKASLSALPKYIQATGRVHFECYHKINQFLSSKLHEALRSPALDQIWATQHALEVARGKPLTSPNRRPRPGHLNLMLMTSYEWR